NHDILAELRDALALELEVAALGAQLAREREALAVEARFALAGSDQAHVGPLEHAEVLRLPGELGVAVGKAQRPRAGGVELAVARLDAEALHLQPVSRELRAQLAVLEIDAVARVFEGKRV